jgi:hypothetical protein
MTGFLEIDVPLDRLTRQERDTLDRAFERRAGPEGRDQFVVKRGVSPRAGARALAVIVKHRLMMGSLGLPEPPTPGDWRVWHYRRQADWKLDALAAKDSPVRGDLRGKKPETRKVLAIRAVKAVETFRRRAPAWWFDICARLMSIDA